MASPRKGYVPTEEPQMGDQDKDPGGTHKSIQKGRPSFSHASCPEGHGDDRAEPVMGASWVKCFPLPWPVSVPSPGDIQFRHRYL